MGSFEVGSAAGGPTAETAVSGWRGKSSWLILGLEARLRARLANEALAVFKATMEAAKEARHL